MPFLELIRYLDLLGTFVFALSGALVASKKDMDILGSLVLAVVTACGGGTLRSVLIGDFPVTFLKDPYYLLLSILAVLLVVGFKAFVEKLEKPILFLDAIGLGIFVSIGISVALSHGLNWWASLLMGMITGSFGGVIRDVLSNEIPLIFQKEIYATACLIGGFLFLLMRYFHFSQELTVSCSAILVCLIRLFAVKQNWALPKG